MQTEFFKFSILLLLKDRYKHLFSSSIFILIIFLLTSVLFISESIKSDLIAVVDNQPEIIIENSKGGKYTEITDEYIDTIVDINGVEDVNGKIDGYYHFMQNNRYFHIIGDDEQKFDNMKIGEGIKKILENFYYQDYFNFFIDGEALKINIEDVFSKDANLITNDLMILNSEQASFILGLDDDEYSYLTVTVPNSSEIDYIAQKIQRIFPNLRIKTKSEQLADIDNIFYYKGGIFMILYIIVMALFLILIYHQIDSSLGNSKKEIAILRTLGYSINNIISLKLIQHIIVAIFSYFFGIILAYYYVFIFNAPILKTIFLGSQIENNLSFTPIINISILTILTIIFIFTVIPFIIAVILPSWKIAITDMKEALK